MGRKFCRSLTYATYSDFVSNFQSIRDACEKNCKKTEKSVSNFTQTREKSCKRTGVKDG